ncbi:hypothetical protein FACS1894191_1930 [Clostridia bacterium]|nr:hypothetical protein FACS1894191_1930 [Clostridia bacterium]
MRKFMDVDIIGALGAIMERNTKSYQSDFEYDKTRLLEAAASTDAEDKALIWMSRENGTWCFNERDSLIAGTEANVTWLYYDGAGESVLDFSVVILGEKDGRPVGNLYQLDYGQHLQLLKRAALPIEAVAVRFADGSEKRFPHKEINGNWQSIQFKQGSDITAFKYEVEDEGALQFLLKQEHAARGRFPSRSVAAYIKGLPAPAKPSVTEKLEAAKAEAAKQASPKKSGPRKSKGAEL